MIEFIYTWPNGRQEIRYSRSKKSKDCLKMISEIEILKAKYGLECPYSYNEI